jgi:cell division protease FtsH
MMNITTVANLKLEDVRNIYGIRVSEILQVPLKQLQIVTLPYHHLYTKFRDHPIKRHPLTHDLPEMMLAPLHKAGLPSIGITHYRCRGLQGLEYAVVVTYSDYGTGYWFFTKKKETFRIARNCNRLARLSVQKNKPPVIDEAILKDIQESVIGFLGNEKLIASYDVTMNRGIILDGPPGNGKTMLCRYIERLCYDNNISCSSVTSTAIDTAYKENRLTELFRQTQVTFFDDIDIGYFSRSHGDGKMACSLLTAMDGMSQGSSLAVRIFTTNEQIETLDPAFVRPGRIDRRITIDKPNTKLRKQLISRWKSDIRENIDVGKLLGESEGWSGAQIESVKGFLVEGYFNGHSWNLDRALKLAAGKALNDTRKPLGFIAESIIVDAPANLDAVGA